MIGFKIAVVAALAVSFSGCGVFGDRDKVLLCGENFTVDPIVTPNIEIGLPKLRTDRPDYDFRWDLPYGYEVTDIGTSDGGMTVKVRKSANPGPRRAYRIVLIQGGNDTK